MRRWACCGTSSASCQSCRSPSSGAGPAVPAANWRWPATCASPPGRTPSWDRSRSARPRARGVQHLARLLGRSRAMEAILGADDFDAEQAERYGWINPALPDAELDAFVARLARRIASFPADAVQSAKRAQRADHARSGRDPSRRPTVPPAGRLGHGQGPHGRPVHTRPADPKPARTRPRRPPWSPLTQIRE